MARRLVAALVLLAAFGLVIVVGDFGWRSAEPLSATRTKRAPVTPESSEELRAPTVEIVPSRVEPAEVAATSELEPQGPPPPAPIVSKGMIDVTVVDAAGNPVQGAAARAVSTSSNLTINVQVLARRRGPETDARGRIRLTGVSLEEMRVYAQAEGLAPGLSAPVQLTESEPHAAVTLTLPVGGRVVGRLHDLRGGPAEGIGLTMHLARRAGERGPTAMHSGTTDGNGAFELVHLQPGTWTLLARGRDEGLVPAQQVELEVRDGETTEALFKDIRATAVQVSGQVLYNGVALAGASIHVGQADPARASFLRETESDSEGRFRITLDEGGEYRFMVGKRPREGTVILDVEIPQAPTHFVELAIVTGSLAGTVFGPDGRPVAGVEVMALSKPAAGRALFSASAKTDDAGRYELLGVPAGTYLVSARIAKDADTPTVGVGAAQVQEVTLARGEALTGVDVQMTAGGSIAGRTLDAAGRPVAGARVEIRSLRSYQRAQSDDDGHFQAEGIPEGEHWLRATSGELTSSPTPVSVASRVVTEVELVLVPGGTVSAEVEDAAGPVEKAFVTLLCGPEIASLSLIVENGKGTKSAVPPGTYAVLARRDYRVEDGPKVETTLTVVSGGEHVLRLRLP